MNFQMRRSSDAQVRFEAHSEFEYQQGETLAGNFFVNNKINKEFRASLNFGRNKTESNIIPNYYAEALLDSQLIDSKYFRFFFRSFERPGQFHRVLHRSMQVNSPLMSPEKSK